MNNIIAKGCIFLYKKKYTGQFNRMSILKNILIKATGNLLAQKILQKNIYVFQYLSGIGSGSISEHSGEKIVFKTLKKRYDPPYCIFDVGSNKGQYLRLIDKHLKGNNFSAHCFEPHYISYEYLKATNKNPDVIINNIALADEEGEKKLYYNENDSRFACLTKRRLEHHNIDLDHSQNVKIDTVDGYCSKNNINKIHLLKIDVEGHEFDVLKGAVKMFKENKIDIIAFEFGGTGIDTKIFLQDFYYFFKNYNKTLYRITPSGYLYKIDKYNEMLEQFRTTNFIALGS